MSQNNVSERDRAYQHMVNNLKPNLRQYPLDPREAIETIILVGLYSRIMKT